MERHALYFLLPGVGVLVTGLVWLLIASMRQWRFWPILFPPLLLVFPFVHWRRGLPPFLVLLAGAGVALFPVAYTRLVPLDLGPYERLVDGEVHLTLTGWDRKDYSFLGSRKDIVVLQMANPDVTDEVLGQLRGMSLLRELDISRTQVSDTGLAVLAELPQLEVLRLTGTAISDVGLRQQLLEARQLKRLDLRETRVSPEARREWRARYPGRLTNPR